jgi:hypothetical protein
MNIVHVKEKLERARANIARVREHAKNITNEVVHTALGAATAAGLGALDESKGTTHDNDMGITDYRVGPLPASLVVAAIGKAAAVTMSGDATAQNASAIGQGALDAFAYVSGRRLWRRHAAQATTTTTGG